MVSNSAIQLQSLFCFSNCFSCYTFVQFRPMHQWTLTHVPRQWINLRWKLWLQTQYALIGIHLYMFMAGYCTICSIFTAIGLWEFSSQPLIELWWYILSGCWMSCCIVCTLVRRASKKLFLENGKAWETKPYTSYNVKRISFCCSDAFQGQVLWISGIWIAYKLNWCLSIDPGWWRHLKINSCD